MSDILYFEIETLDLSNKNIDDKIIINLCENKKFSAINYINFASSNFAYRDLIKLWDSSILGKVSNVPVYEKHTGNPVKTISIEIVNTIIYDQYIKKKFKYPLPLRADFKIKYGNKIIGKPYALYGYKNIKLLFCGKEIKPTSFNVN